MICQLVNVSLQQVSYDDDIKILCKCCKEFKEDTNVMFVSKSCSTTNRPRLDLSPLERKPLKYNIRNKEKSRSQFVKKSYKRKRLTETLNFLHFFELRGKLKVRWIEGTLSSESSFLFSLVDANLWF